MIIIVIIPRCSSKVLTRKQHGRRLKVWALSRVSFDQSESLRLLQGKCWHCAVLAICSVSYEIPPPPPPRPLHLVLTAQWLLAWSESVRCNNILLAWPPPHWMCYSKRRAGQRWYECFSWLLKMKCMTDFEKVRVYEWGWDTGVICHPLYLAQLQWNTFFGRAMSQRVKSQMRSPSFGFEGPSLTADTAVHAHVCSSLQRPSGVHI